MRAAREPARRSSAKRLSIALNAFVKSSSSTLSLEPPIRARSGWRKSTSLISAAKVRSGTKARRTRTKLTASIATNATTRTRSSPARIGWLTVTGVTTRRTKIKASRALLERSARRAIDFDSREEDSPLEVIA
jgi:hypothetical protein